MNTKYFTMRKNEASKIMNERLASIEERLWLIENPPRFNFDQKVEFHVSHNLYGDWIDEIGIIKGIESIRQEHDIRYVRYYHVESNNSIRIILENAIKDVK
jgi:hypothetical protein